MTQTELETELYYMNETLGSDRTDGSEYDASLSR
jgi:hypothetical protein